jgi:hypothetical protein
MLPFQYTGEEISCVAGKGVFFATIVCKFLFVLLVFYAAVCYNVMSAKEKQAAAQAAICFSCAINEQTVCEADQGARNARVCE